MQNLKTDILWIYKWPVLLKGLRKLFFNCAAKYNKLWSDTCSVLSCDIIIWPIVCDILLIRSLFGLIPRSQRHFLCLHESAVIFQRLYLHLIHSHNFILSVYNLLYLHDLTLWYFVNALHKVILRICIYIEYIYKFIWQFLTLKKFVLNLCLHISQMNWYNCFGEVIYTALAII